MRKKEKQDLRKAVAAKIREIRGAESQRAFGKKCQLSQARVSELEAGGGMPGMVVLLGICRATGTDPMEFVRLVPGFETKGGGHE